MPQALKQGWGAHRDLSGSAAADAGFVFCVFFAFFSVFFLSRESHKRARAVPPPHSPALSGRPPHAAVREGGERREGAVRRARPSRERAA